jgi:hypothetical protein
MTESKDLEYTGVVAPGWNQVEPPFITECAKCKKEIRLLKDSTENMKVYCGGCYENRG